MRVLQIAFLAMLVSLVAPQQPLGASLEGMVVRSGTNEGVSRARVELLTGTTISLTTTADAEGRFFFPNVQPGQYRLVSSRTGYVDGEYGLRRKPAIPVSAMSSHQPAPVTLTGGQRLQGVRLEMVRGGVISGRVVVSGKPVGNVDVKALASSHELGLRVLTTVLSSRTNDLGEYRIFWLPPGQYYVVADVLELQAAPNSQTVMTGLDPSSNPLFLTSMPLRFVMSRAIGAGGNDATMFVSMYPPGVPDWRNSTPIALGAGSQFSGVDIQVNPVPSLHVRGSITGAPASPGGPAARPSLSLVPLNAGAGLIDAGIVVTMDPNGGTFDFSRVSPGAYVLSASVGNLRGRVSLDVRDRDINNVIVPLIPGMAVPGRVVIEGAASNDPDARLGALRISLLEDLIGGSVRQTNRNMTTPLVTPGTDGSFTLGNPASPGIPAGNYRVLVSPILTAAAGWAFPPAALPTLLMPTAPVPPALETAYVKSIRMGDIDVLNDGLRLTSQPDAPLTIVVGTNPGSIEGRVLNAQQQPVAACMVVLIPENGLQFRTNHRFASTDAAGRFQIARVAPGDYSVYAWEDVEPGAWQDPDFIAAFRNRAVSVRIEEGKRITADLPALP